MADLAHLNFPLGSGTGFTARGGHLSFTSVPKRGSCPHQTLAAGMQVLRRGNRLSITRVSPDEWRAVLVLLED
ncbi:MAG: hypothetical protein IPF94_17995 [Betaproteobacteria bacterium]|nr:hypothetical protein [Betaproteobacteria bacterium]